MLLMGPGIRGGRVVGGTDERFRPLKVDPAALLPTGSGVALKPEHLHRALRRLAGVEDTALVRQFPLPGEDLPLLV
jgi:hypothetical protein